MQNVLTFLKSEILKVCQLEHNIQFVCETPKTKEHGDYSTNIAMVYAKVLRKSPKDVSQTLIPKIQTLGFVKEVLFLNGFINIFVRQSFFLERLCKIYSSTALPQLSNGEKINVEYVSANPTGPLHIGHLRGAIYGDTLASLLEKTGFNVVKEYYINDAGNQINILAKSTWVRYCQLLGQSVEVQEGGYPAEYILKIAKEILEKHGASLQENDEIFKTYPTKFNLNWIKKTLASLKIQHDVFSSEKEIVNSNSITKAFKVLEEKNLLYRGIPPKPVKTKEENRNPQECLLFKSTQFGDDEDRVVQKNDESYTYCVPDMVYNKNKIQRGFSKIIMVLGADHIGYIKRLQAMTQALAEKDFTIDIKICQIVKFLQNGNEFKMSKRAGNFVTVDEILEHINTDILRFMMLTKKNDIHMDFDIEKAKEHTKENPIWYIQYAYSRLCSVLRKSEIQTANFKNAELSPFFEDLAKKVIEFPSILEVATINHEPHHLAYYGQSLASILHSVWTEGNQNPQARFITQNHTHNQNSINIILSTIKVFEYLFDIFNIEPLKSM